MAKHRTVGFGAPPEPAPGRFLVEPLPDGGVRILEETAADDQNGQAEAASPAALEAVERATLDRELWLLASRQAAYEFNPRLKEAGLPTGRWSSREPTPVERLLGRELCVLAWAIQGAQGDEGEFDETIARNVLRQWALLRPEERWWLFRRAATSEGWRMALAVALSLGQGLKDRLPTVRLFGKRRRSKAKDANGQQMSMFDQPGDPNQTP